MFKRLLLGVVASTFLAACSGSGRLLPRSVYFLEGPRGGAQVWRLETDGATLTQMTQAESGVSAFAVSSADGSLAFVSDNRLFLEDGNGESRRLVADGNLVQAESEDLVIANTVEAPSFSPDGRTLAYALDGLHLFSVVTGVDRHELVNGGNLLGEEYKLARENYSPGDWSPDGSRLVLWMGYGDGTTLAVMEPGQAQPFVRMRSKDLVAGGVSWSPDSRSLYVANPDYSVDWPGLWRYDALSGKEYPLVTTQPGTSRFVGWPVELASGRLLFFYGEQFFPDSGIPLVMVRSDADGSNRVSVRQEQQHIGDALWAPDGSLAVISHFTDGAAGQLVLARPDESPLRVLAAGEWIRQLAWGR